MASGVTPLAPGLARKVGVFRQKTPRSSGTFVSRPLLLVAHRIGSSAIPTYTFTDAAHILIDAGEEGPRDSHGSA